MTQTDTKADPTACAGREPSVWVIGTMLFQLITAGRVPSYLGNSFAFIGILVVTVATPTLFSRIALIVGIADCTWTIAGIEFAGIALGTAAALLTFHLMRGINHLTKAVSDAIHGTGDDLAEQKSRAG